MAACKRCGLERTENTIACQGCGQPFPSPSLRAAKASLILGLLSIPLLCAMGLGALSGVLAVFFGILALVRAARTPSVESGRASAVWGILLGGSCAVLPVLLSWPALHASRVRENENATITEIRSVLEAELKYSAVNADLYDKLECLATPSRCIPGYDASKPSFLDAELAAATVKHGYTRTFHGVPAPSDRPKGTSPSSLEAYAYVAMPASPGSTGERSFCGDQSGRVCSMEDGASPPLTPNGECAPSCHDLR
jgi:hypothetical protein